MSEALWLFDATAGEVLYVSAGYERVWGRPAPASCADLAAWLGPVHPDDRERLRAFAWDWQSITTPRTERLRFQRTPHDTRVVRVALFPVTSSNGARVAGGAEDVTEHSQLEEQVRQAAKLESIGLLAGGVAHDFNNVLAVIGANAGMLAETTTAPDERELVGEISDAVVRGTGLTRQLLAFSRKEVVEPVVLDLAGAVKDARKMLRRMVGEDIVIQTSLDPQVTRVLMDPGYLVQVLMNLAVNARDAMPRGGTLAISTRVVDATQLLLSISDTGCGMSPEVRARVFEPFFTTKGVGKGTGLGLSVVSGIVQQAGGRIEVESQLGRGTEIRIFLPRVDPPAARAADAPDHLPTPVHGTELVVVVDDDVFIRRSTARALHSRGFRVVEAADGNAALRLLDKHGQDVALLLTDVVMPGIDGPQLASLGRARRPSLKVLYMSGYTDDAVLNHGMSAATGSFLEKPFGGHALAGRVRDAIDRR